MQNFVDLVNEVNWDNVQPVQWATSMPSILFELYNNSENQPDRETVEALRACISYNSGIYETTEQTVPLLIFLLGEEKIKNKKWVLEVLYTVRFSANLHYSTNKSVYNSMYQGFNQIAKFINSEDISERWFTVNILSHFILHKDAAYSILITRLKLEHDNSIIIAILSGILHLYREYEDYSKVLEISYILDKKNLSNGLICLLECILFISLENNLSSKTFDRIRNCLEKYSDSIMNLDAGKQANIGFDILDSLRNVDYTAKKNALNELLSMDKLPIIIRKILKEKEDKI